MKINRETSHLETPVTEPCAYVLQGDTAPRDWIAGVALAPDALAYIAQLYQALDRNGDGVLTVTDFTMDGFSLQVPVAHATGDEMHICNTSHLSGILHDFGHACSF